jgi:hypothetical protein
VVWCDINQQGDSYASILAGDYHSSPGFQHFMANFSFYWFLPLRMILKSILMSVLNKSDPP